MDELLIETMVRIASSLEFIVVVLVGILIVQFFTLLFKDNNGGFYLRQIDETLRDIINKNVKE